MTWNRPVARMGTDPKTNPPSSSPTSSPRYSSSSRRLPAIRQDNLRIHINRLLAWRRLGRRGQVPHRQHQLLHQVDRHPAGDRRQTHTKNGTSPSLTSRDQLRRRPNPAAKRLDRFRRAPLADLNPQSRRPHHRQQQRGQLHRPDHPRLSRVTNAGDGGLISLATYSKAYGEASPVSSPWRSPTPPSRSAPSPPCWPRQQGQVQLQVSGNPTAKPQTSPVHRLQRSRHAAHRQRRQYRPRRRALRRRNQSSRQPGQPSPTQPAPETSSPNSIHSSPASAPMA